MPDTTIRAAWLGVGGALLGAILAVVAQPIVNEWLGPKREGIFSVEQTCLSGKNLDPTVASQVTSFPCQLRIAHIEGPAVTKLSVALVSAHPLSGIKTERDDENTSPSLSASDDRLTLDVPTLRQGSIIDIRFVSVGEPNIDKNIVRESGRLVSDATSLASPRWFETWYGITLILTGVGAAASLGAYLLYQSFIKPSTGPVPAQTLLGWAALAMLAFLPLADVSGFVQTLLLFAILFVVAQKHPTA